MAADLESAEKIHLHKVGWHFCLNFVVDQYYFILTVKCLNKILDPHRLEETVCIYLAMLVIGCKNVLGFKE